MKTQLATVSNNTPSHQNEAFSNCTGSVYKYNLSGFDKFIQAQRFQYIQAISIVVSISSYKHTVSIYTVQCLTFPSQQ